MRRHVRLQPTPDEERLRQTGEWWADPWWLKGNWFEVRPLTPKQVEDAFEYLKKIFPSDWVRNYKGDLVENLFLRSVLYDRSAFTRSHLVSLAERLRRCEKVPGVHAVIANLHKRHESDAADMELDLADSFAQGGYQVEFPIAKSAKGKSPDIRLSKGSSRFVVECKRLSVSDMEAWLTNVFNHAISKLMDVARSNGLGIDFVFSEAVVRGLLESRSAGVAEVDAADNLISWVAEELEAAIARGKWPVWMWIDNRGSGFFYQTDSTVGSQVGHPGVPDELLVRRIVQNAVVPAAKQLGVEDAPGIIAIHTRDLPSVDYLADELSKFLFENREEYSHILAVMVFPWQYWFQRNRPQLVFNRHGKHSCDTSNMVGLLNKFDPIIS